MAGMPVKWKLKEFLVAHDITVYRFWRASGMAKGTAYRLANGQTSNLNTVTLDATMKALRELTGEIIDFNEILEWTEI